MPTENSQIPVQGMTCQKCVDKVTGQLAALPGVVRIDVDLGTACARVEHDSQRTDRAALCRAIEAAGFSAN